MADLDDGTLTDIGTVDDAPTCPTTRLARTAPYRQLGVVVLRSTGTIDAPNTSGGHVLARWQFWVTTVVALLVALVAGYNMMLFRQNRLAQAEFARRAQYVQQSVQLEGLYREIVKALADLSVRNQDKALTDLLASQGITLSGPTAPAAPSAATPSAQTGPGTKP